jgi:hypothetical protein
MLLLLVAALFASAVGFAPSEWPQRRHDAHLSGRSNVPITLPNLATSLRFQLWGFRDAIVDGQNNLISVISPIAPTPSQAVVAVSPSGATLWTMDNMTFPAAYCFGLTVVSSAVSPILHAVANGKTVLSTPSLPSSCASLLCVNDVLVCCASPNVIVLNSSLAIVSSTSVGQFTPSSFLSRSPCVLTFDNSVAVVTNATVAIVPLLPGESHTLPLIAAPSAVSLIAAPYGVVVATSNFELLLSLLTVTGTPRSIHLPYAASGTAPALTSRGIVFILSASITGVADLVFVPSSFDSFAVLRSGLMATTSLSPVVFFLPPPSIGEQVVILLQNGSAANVNLTDGSFVSAVTFPNQVYPSLMVSANFGVTYTVLAE